jgi:hypothetical protein
MRERYQPFEQVRSAAFINKEFTFGVFVVPVAAHARPPLHQTSILALGRSLIIVA